MHFTAVKFQNFLGEHAPKTRSPRKGVLMGPSLFIVSILTSWLLEHLTLDIFILLLM